MDEISNSKQKLRNWKDFLCDWSFSVKVLNYRFSSTLQVNFKPNLLKGHEKGPFIKSQTTFMTKAIKQFRTMQWPMQLKYLMHQPKTEFEMFHC